MLLGDLLGAIEEKRVENFIEVDVTDLAFDSRMVRPGGAFFCIKGLVTDGHLYAGEAVRRGAAVVFLERDIEEELGDRVVRVRVPDTRLALALTSTRFFGDPSEELRLVGVTGTNGKTTTTFLTESICRTAGMRTGLLGTIENHILDRIEPVTRTTPESLDLQNLLRRMVDAGVEAAVMEVSSHALDLRRVNGCKFDVVVFTNLTQDHLDFHISIEEYFGAKRRLFVGDDFGKGRKAVINMDDPFGRRLLSEIALECVSFGVEGPADVKGTVIDVGPRGNRFSLTRDRMNLEITTELQGRFNVYNCLAAAAVALELGVDADYIKDGLASLKGVPGRFEKIDCGQDFTVIVDYAHTPDGIRSLLEACREVSEARVIIVVGCGGDRDRSKRPLMGRVAVQMSDLCIITSDNPRSEDPMQIIEMMIDGFRGEAPPEKYRVQVERREAIREAIHEASPGDLVVIAGKGHERGQIFSDGVVPFDDREVAREVLKEMSGA